DLLSGVAGQLAVRRVERDEVPGVVEEDHRLACVLPGVAQQALVDEPGRLRIGPEEAAGNPYESYCETASNRNTCAAKPARATRPSSVRTPGGEDRSASPSVAWRPGR